MIIVYSVVLFLLGLLGAESLITPKVPAFRNFLIALAKYQEVLGLLGIVSGAVYLPILLDMIGFLRLIPGHFFLMLAAEVVIIALGLIFGLEVIRRNLKDTSSTLFVKLENFRLFSLRSQKPFGVAGVVLGLIIFFDHI